MKFLNKLFKFLLLVLVLFIIFTFVIEFVSKSKSSKGDFANNPLNLIVKIQNEVFQLKNGLAENIITPISASKNILRVFGEPVFGDLDEDKDNDAVMLLQNDTGGSGMFYYVVLAINNGSNSYQSTEAMYVGDRIAPQNVGIREGRALVNYAIRKEGDPMTENPSIGKTLWIHYDKKTNQIGEWAKDFEGESR